MQRRTIDNVIDEFQEEGHLPMLKLARELSRANWIEGLCFDTSMLRLWISHTTVSEVEIIITYADGRNGGLPLKKNLDCYNIVFTSGNKENSKDGIKLKDMVKIIKEWK